MNENKNKHRLNAADIITFLRIAGTIMLLVLQPLSAEFFLIYVLTGLTDVLDGWIARKRKTASDFGARLDSIADLLFYIIMMFRVFPLLWNKLPGHIWFAVAVIVAVRLTAYLTAVVKYHRFASVHTYLNKLTGIAVFLVPFLLVTDYAVGFCRLVCVVAMVASFEELTIHLQRRERCPDTKSIFIRKT